MGVRRLPKSADAFFSQTLNVMGMRWNSMMNGAAVLALSLALLTGCGTSSAVGDEDARTESKIDLSFVEISDSLESDPDMEALVAPYRADMEDEVQRVIAHAPTELTEGNPEGELGNLAADAMLHYACELSEDHVDMALTNNGGLRIPIGPGAITVGTVYELMPFENRMVVLTLTGEQLQRLVHQLVEMEGEPIAGFSFAYHAASREVEEIRIDGEPIEPSASYRLVTSDYLADGGGPTVLQEADREELPMLLREAFLEYFEKLGTLTPEIEGRIVRIQ